MYNKRGWMRILEATIAVLIVTGVLVVVYSRQVDRGVDPADYFYSLQRQILSDISLSSDLRLNVLNADDEVEDDDDFVALKEFIEGEIQDFVGFSISICDLSDDSDNCRMKSADFIGTRDKNVFVEDMIVSAELGVGDDAQYNPRKIRLFMWEKYT